MMSVVIKKCKCLCKGLAFGFYNSVITHFPVFFIRHLYLKIILGIQIGKSSSIGLGCFITGKNIIIGNNTVINRYCFLDGRAGIRIGNNVSISPNVSLISLTHDKDAHDFSTIGKPVDIDDYVWIGMGALILPGVILNKGAIAGAGAVVTKSVQEYDVVGGNPARVISHRSKNLSYNLIYFPILNSDVTFNG